MKLRINILILAILVVALVPTLSSCGELQRVDSTVESTEPYVQPKQLEHEVAAPFLQIPEPSDIQTTTQRELILQPKLEPDLHEHEPILERRFYITTANLNLRERPDVDSESRGVVPMGSPVELLEYYSDEWSRVWTYRGLSDSYSGYMASEFLSRAMSSSWPMPDIEISGFGHQVVEEFLDYFDEVFALTSYVIWRF